ncbi:UbiA family prenyltransferase [Phycisphaera mikurensis]|uniref:Putative prenyltransferase n=1 Tax=Phycisphaera mikurensis (strain NBRC 102666 / KCTC 22515 / FYK2301M01) TaxID=1142394 RepID=I0IAF6_PHYMF|nr:UbiA family prenyltransferase [Phycisphaera mikurensis]MBB6441759.1 hypothetical protein [Phycisphaera mikurensis]BAM02244.1 putative prenyltransferase [Phycisphaera mikurensis NBRC 102666]
MAASPSNPTGVAARAARGAALLAACRPRQWPKNLLVAVPMLAGHAAGDGTRWLAVALAAAAFSAVASVVYLVNDLLDADADRLHPTKRERPIASGRLRPGVAKAAVPGLLLLAAALTAALFLVDPPVAAAPGATAPSPAGFAATLLGYATLAFAYSLRLKREPIVDVACLSGFYLARLLAGGFVVGLFPSPWLLGFAGAVFLTLALGKRYAELLTLFGSAVREHSPGTSAEAVPGRGWQPSDAPLVLAMGVASAWSAGVVLTLYLSSDAVRALYAHPRRLAIVVGLVLFGLNRLWFLAHRGRIHGDPLTFLVRDPVTWALGAATLAAAWAAR